MSITQKRQYEDASCRSRLARRTLRSQRAKRERRARNARRGLFAVTALSMSLMWSTAFATPHITDQAAPATLEALMRANPAFAEAYTSGSRFVTGEKTNVELCNFAYKAKDDGWNYVYGGKGQRMSDSLIASIVSSNLGDARSPYLRAGYIEQTQLQTGGQRATDCSGLVMDFMWWAGDDSDPIRSLCPSIGMYNANNMLEAAVEKGPIETMPEIPGLLVHSNGHVGIYIGDGEVIEARGVRYGVVKTRLAERSFRYWSKSPWIDYEVSGLYKVGDRTVFLDNGEDIGQERWIAKYVYGDLSQGSTYVPVLDESATFRTEAPAVLDVEEPPAAVETAVPEIPAQDVIQTPAVPEVSQQPVPATEQAAPPAPEEAEQQQTTLVETPESTPVPDRETDLTGRMLAVIDQLPYDPLQGYLFEGHWYLVQMDEAGNVFTVLNDPDPDAPGTAGTANVLTLQEALRSLMP
ncbi:MAG: C40 family peptidase [Clostridia bacterium]|nr:C40 family peptidase [Clostridia bacterium]